MSFEEKIQTWVTLDNQIKLLNDRARELREQRNEAEESIHNYVETQNLSNATVKISDGKLRFVSSRSTAPLTFRYIEGCLSKCIQNDEQVGLIMKYIKESRDVKYSPDIKRTYDN